MDIHQKITSGNSCAFTLNCKLNENKLGIKSLIPELKTLESWISGLMLNLNFFLISRLNMACSPHEFNLQKSQQIGIKDITF